MPTKTEKSSTSYPQGSEWRRWDLHVHSPESVLENKFANWDQYIDSLESAGKGVAALGITDYCLIEGYKRALDYRAKGRLAKFDLVMPNVEFRIQPETPDGRGINIHVLVSPEDPTHVEKTEQALAKLTFKYKGNPYSCTRAELIALGKAYDMNQKDDDAAFRAGVNLFKPGFDSFRDWYNDHDWLQANSLVVISNSKDGASGLSKDAGFAAQREELYRFAHIVFSGNPKDREYFLGNGSDKESEMVRKYGSLKPCIHGSDAHQESKLFEPDKKRYCWIKADPTFEGLRQILYEQQDRVYIGPTAPTAIDESKIIDSVAVDGAAQWFSSSTVRLNPGLVTIIGEKGSGKTALVDLIAYAASAYEQGRSSSFIEKANPFLEGVSVTINWRSGAKTTASLDEDQPGALPTVRYLSQDFVEELCSKDTSGEQLVREIEDVVFSYIDESERLEASSFEELRRLKTEHLSSKRVNLRAHISKLNSEIVKLEDIIASKGEKEKLKAKAEEEIAAIDKQLPALQKSVNKDVAEKLAKEKDALKARQKELGETNKLLGRIQTLRSKVDDFREQLQRGYNELAEILRELTIPEADIVKFELKLAPGFDLLINRREEELTKAAEKLKGDTNKPVKDGSSIADIEARIAELEKTVAADAKERGRLLALEKQKVKLQTERDRLSKELNDIEAIHGKTLTNKREERWKDYLESFKLMGKEREALQKLYEPLGEVLSVDPTGAKMGFELSVKQTPDVDEWLEAGRSLVDQRKKHDFSEKNFRKELDKQLGTPWSNGDEKEIRAGLQRVLDTLAEGVEMNGVLVSHATRLQVYDWAFSTDHIHIEYGLKYQGTELTLLSPGARGIVLLVLYLEMDRHDRRPLIIDQPEGNLDNSSIYDSLVPYLRRAKKDRQIILVTHNPNLVVTADADQVIVASAYKKAAEPHPIISYKAGSLEDSKGKESIREFVCRLLEGGRRAFKIRENKYALGTDIE